MLKAMLNAILQRIFGISTSDGSISEVEWNEFVAKYGDKF